MKLRERQAVLPASPIPQDFSDTDSTCSSDSELTTMQKTEEQFKTKVWKPQENKNLQKGVEKYGPRSWDRIAEEFVPGHTGEQCRLRWTRTLNPKIKLGKWNEDEDEALQEGVMQYGEKAWALIAEECVKTRTGDQCRQRWGKTLKPSIKKGTWSEDEDEALREGVMQYGKSWTRIVKKFVHEHTAKQCKTRWEKTLSKSRIKVGPWDEEEDEDLRNGVKKLGNEWTRIAKEFVKTRNATQCQQRWEKTLKTSIKLGPWDEKEDDALRQGVEKHGEKAWALIAKEFVKTRSDKQSRQRWKMLNSKHQQGQWSSKEDEALMEGVELYGLRAWTRIAKECVKTRSGDQCLHHWKTLNSSNKKKSGSVGQKRPRNSYTDTAYESEYQTDNEAKESTSSEPIQEVLPPETECLEKLPTHTRSAAVDTLWGSTFPNIEVYEDDDSPFPKRARVEHSPTMPLPLWDTGIPSASETMQSAYNEDMGAFPGIVLEETVTNVNYMLKV